LVHIKLLGAITILIVLAIPVANASEPVMITVSPTMDKVIFDGKWTFYSEWKPASLNTISYNDGTLIQLRSAHQGNFIYILIDEVSKTRFNKHGDIAIICFDKNNSKSITPNENDYCFGNSFDNKNAFTLRGGSPLEETDHYMKIQNPEGLVGVSGVSDENDRYTDVPHASYEFRIPTDVVGRSDDYGFYLGVYDKNSDHVYSWPQEVTTSVPFKIPPPKNWGEIISPDKSLPEFPWPIFMMVLSFSLIVFVTRRHFLSRGN
jgi:hypothetical protein